MSLRVSAPSLANTSPSVALEKGAYYRTRASRPRAASTINTLNPYTRPRIRHRNQHSTNLILILVLLVFTCLGCFGTAYYLFKTRWEIQKQYFIQAPRANITFHQVVASLHHSIGYYYKLEQVHADERFLAYMPHSGFHNQRIALENALVLARLLNRTLIVPPIRLGNRPIPYYPHDRLTRILALTDKTALKHCLHISPSIAMPPECLDYFEYTHLPWDWLVDLTSVRAKQKLLLRWNFSEDWFFDTLPMSNDQILRFRDQTPYQYRFVDSTGPPNVKIRHTEDLYIPFLAGQTQKLLLFGTLFGSSRLHLEEEGHLATRKEIREAMTIMHPILDQVSESIFRSLGGAYLAVHLRANEIKFADASQENARTLWWTLLHRFLNMTADDTLQLEARMEETRTSQIQHSSNIPLSALSNHYTPLSDIEWSRLASASSTYCNQSQKNLFALGLLDRHLPLLYIATDLKNPRKQPLLSRFRTVFPCTFYLSDFTRHLTPLDQVINPIDGIPLRSQLLPFIDALVAAKALRVTGTKGSTFSHYIEDVLWRNNHNIPIKQRG